MFDPSRKDTGIKILDHKAFIEEISEFAQKEYQNENIMKKMKGEWEPLEFTCVQMQGKDGFILAGESVELIQTALDDHIMKTQTMKSSPYAEFMFAQIEQWENTLMRTQDNLELWLKVQAVWMNLEPVF